MTVVNCIALGRNIRLAFAQKCKTHQRGDITAFYFASIMTKF